jgi:adenylate cyclase
VTDTAETAVAFADLVGFTELGQTVPVEELTGLAGRLGRIAGRVVDPPVRVVKQIGDAVMLVSPDVAALVGLALELIDAVDAEGEDFPQVHVGIAYGPAVNRGGDFFGSPVNVASRVSAIARAGTLLATADASEQVRELFDWSFAGERRLKGVGASVRLYRGRRQS